MENHHFETILKFEGILLAVRIKLRAISQVFASRLQRIIGIIVPVYIYTCVYVYVPENRNLCPTTRPDGRSA